MNADQLELIVRSVGLMTAILGTVATVPGAFLHLSAESWARVKLLVVKLFRIRRDARIQGGVIATDIAMTSDAAGVVVRGVAGTIEERVAALERRLDHTERQLDEVRENMRVETAERKAEDAHLAETIKAEVQKLETALRELEQRNNEINARALLVVIWGIVLTTVGDWLALVWWLGWTCAAVGVAASVWAAISIRRYRTEMINAER